MSPHAVTQLLLNASYTGDGIFTSVALDVPSSHMHAGYGTTRAAQQGKGGYALDPVDWFCRAVRRQP